MPKLPSTPRRPSPDAWLILAVFGLSFALYWPTLSPTVVADDGGELQMLASALGVAHPTGYPLFTVLGWLFTRLPLGGDAAFRVTLFCAVSAAASAALLYLTARELRAGRPAAFAAALLVAAAPRVWMHAAAAEVYALSNFFILLGICLLLRWGAGKTPLWLVTLALGFGLTHHIALRLFGPAMLVYVLWVDTRLLLHPRKWLPALACLLLPLLVYAYLPLRATYLMGQPQWAGDILGIPKALAAGLISPHYYGGFWNLVLAIDYSQQFVSSAPADLGPVLVQFLGMLRDQFPLVALALVALGIACLWRRDRKASVMLLIGAGTVWVLGLWFLAQVGEDGDNFIPVYLVMGLWFAVGADAALNWLTEWVARRAPTQRRTVSAALVVCLCAIPLWSIVQHYPRILAMRQPDWSTDFLAQPISQDAVLGGDWNTITPLRYRQQVDGIRPDLWILQVDIGAARTLMDRALAEGRPFYAVRRTAAGPRLLPLPAPENAEIAHPADSGLGSAVRWQGYDLEPAAPRAGDVLRMTLYWRALESLEQDWKTFIHVLDEQGNRVAQVDRVPGNDFYPPTLWQAGRLVADQYELSLPVDLPAGRYSIVFGWYGPEGRLTWEDGADVRTLAEFTIASESAPAHTSHALMHSFRFCATNLILSAVRDEAEGR